MMHNVARHGRRIESIGKNEGKTTRITKWRGLDG